MDLIQRNTPPSGEGRTGTQWIGEFVMGGGGMGGGWVVKV